ncbi:MAG TPA: carboxypeptidase-like regulatory domain-containing protein, partial [Puia sp.]
MQSNQDRLLPLKRGIAMGMLALLSLLSLPVFAQNLIKVKGRVLNETGQPVPKASVTVKGQRGGVACDEDGNFEISAPSNGVLIVSSVGFTPTEMPVGNHTTLTMTLKLS